MGRILRPMLLPTAGQLTTIMMLLALAFPAGAKDLYLEDGKVHVLDHPVNYRYIYLDRCETVYVYGKAKVVCPDNPSPTVLKIKEGAAMYSVSPDNRSQVYIYGGKVDHIWTGPFGAPKTTIYDGEFHGMRATNAAQTDIYGGMFALGCELYSSNCHSSLMGMTRIYGGTFDHRLFLYGGNIYGGTFKYLDAGLPFTIHGRNFAVSECQYINPNQSRRQLTGEWSDGTPFDTLIDCVYKECGEQYHYVNVDVVLSLALGRDAIWYTGGMAPWFSVGSFAQSGSTIRGKTSWIKTTIADGASTISFRWMTSSSTDSKLRFSIDGVVQSVRSGITGWRTKTFSLQPGTHEVKWEFTRRGSAGNNAAYLSKVVIW